jgi:hypothetical protein
MTLNACIKPTICGDLGGPIGLHDPCLAGTDDELSLTVGSQPTGQPVPFAVGSTSAPTPIAAGVPVAALHRRDLALVARARERCTKPNAHHVGKIANGGLLSRIGATVTLVASSMVGLVWAPKVVTLADNRERHARLRMDSGHAGDSYPLWYDMFCGGATIGALVSAGCRATDLPKMGIGINEWHNLSHLGVREFASMGGDWPSLLALGFTPDLMFTSRPTFGLHLLTNEPFVLNFKTLQTDTGCTLDELITDYGASSSDLALLGLTWENLVTAGLTQEQITAMPESHTGMESNLCAPSGTIALFTKPQATTLQKKKNDGPPRLPQYTKEPVALKIGCRQYNF